jgi:Restriction endonuclease
MLPSANTFSGNLTWCWLAERSAHMVEQIDGVIERDGELYLVEIKWWSVPLEPGELSHHLVRVSNRGHARGIFISASARSRFQGETFERLY